MMYKVIKDEEKGFYSVLETDKDDSDTFSRFELAETQCFLKNIEELSKLNQERSIIDQKIMNISHLINIQHTIC